MLVQLLICPAVKAKGESVMDTLGLAESVLMLRGCIWASDESESTVSAQENSEQDVGLTADMPIKPGGMFHPLPCEYACNSMLMYMTYMCVWHWHTCDRKSNAYDLFSQLDCSSLKVSWIFLFSRNILLNGIQQISKSKTTTTKPNKRTQTARGRS